MERFFISLRPKFGFTLSLALAVLVASSLGLTNDALAAHHRARPAPKAAKPATPSEPYAEAAVMEPLTGTFIFEKNDHQPWPTASLAKMMLMMIVVNKLHDGSLKLTDQIPATRESCKMGGSQVYLKEGEVFSLDDMMKAIVVHSANDASVAVAEYMAGSTDAFVQMMNQQAAALGMKDTHYYSVHGLPPAPGKEYDVSSAYDQAVLARELLKYPDTVRWSSIDTAPFRGGTFELRNSNHLVRTYTGCDGLKTGFHDKSKFNVVATAKHGDLRLVAVVLGTPQKLTNFKQAAELMSAGFSQYEMANVVKKGAAATQSVSVTNGATASLTPVFADNAAVFSKRGDVKKDVKVAYTLPVSINAPIKAGQQIGTAEVLADGKVVDKVNLVAPTDVSKKSGGILGRVFGRL